MDENYEEKILNKKTIENIEKDTQNLTGKEKECLIKARVNQGVFRKNLLNKYSKCCLCHICDEQLLIASHIKPWSECEPDEKLKINNDLLLCPIHDKLFDLNLISFYPKGNIMISNKIDSKCYKDLAISENMSIKLNEEMDKYMECHRKSFQKKYNK